MNPSNQPSGTQADPTQHNPQSPSQPQAGASQTPPATQADAANNANTATPPANVNAATQADASNNEPMSLDEAKKLRAEAASLRRRIKEIDDAKAAADLAQLSEAERAKKLAETATAQAAAARAEVAALTVQIEAAKLGFIDPADAAAFLAGKLELDSETGKPTNAAKLLADLLKAKPYLAKAAAEPGNAQQQPNGQPGTPGAPNLGATNPGRGTGGQQAQQAKDPSQLARFGQGRNLFKQP